MTAAGLVVLFVCTAGEVYGQESVTPQSTFAVASVKPSDPDVAGTFVRSFAGGRLQVTGASLKNHISLAYGVGPFQIIGEMEWVDKERFDIDARTETSNAKTPAHWLVVSERWLRHELLHCHSHWRTDRTRLARHTDHHRYGIACRDPRGHLGVDLVEARISGRQSAEDHRRRLPSNRHRHGIVSPR
jgi:hypothetical protein